MNYHNNNLNNFTPEEYEQALLRFLSTLSAEDGLDADFYSTDDFGYSESDNSYPSSFEEQYECISVKDIAKALNCSLTLLYNLIARGELRAIRLGGILRIRKVDFEEFVRNAMNI